MDGESADNGLGQEDLDALLGQARYEHPAADSRYRMYLETRGKLLYLVLEGMVLQATPEEFVCRIEQVLQHQDRGGVVIDLRACDYLSSTALGHLVRFFDRAMTRRSEVVLLRPAEKIRQVIELLGLDGLFLMVEDEAMAEAYFREQGIID